MSRIGKMPVNLPAGVNFSINNDNLIVVKGKLGTLQLKADSRIVFETEGSTVVVKRNSDLKQERALHGLYRALLANMVQGVTDGFQKTIEIIGVGYRANMLDGGILELMLGYSHPFYFVAPEGITLEVDTKTTKTTRIIIKGFDKALVGQIAAKIRSLRAPEPYKGKGLRYLGENVRRKAGKSGGKK